MLSNFLVGSSHGRQNYLNFFVISIASDRKFSSMLLLGIFAIGAFSSKIDDVEESISREVASNFLVRNRRANSWGEEHLTHGNLERECIEETCDVNEFNEVNLQYNNINIK